MEPVPYATAVVPKRHPLRVFAGILGVVLGSLSLASIAVAWMLVVTDRALRAEPFGGWAAALAPLALLASLWNMPRTTSLVAAALAVGAIMALIVLTHV